jgi:hypothetical protein
LDELAEVAARYNGVFWLDQGGTNEELLQVGGRRSLRKIDKDEPI